MPLEDPEALPVLLATVVLSLDEELGGALLLGLDEELDAMELGAELVSLLAVDDGAVLDMPDVLLGGVLGEVDVVSTEVVLVLVRVSHAVNAALASNMGNRTPNVLREVLIVSPLTRS